MIRKTHGGHLTNSLSSTEDVVRRVWCSILGISDAAQDQTFFELGGDSLRMLDMLFQLNQELGVEIDPTLLFEGASLGGFAKLVHEACQSDRPMEEGRV